MRAKALSPLLVLPLVLIPAFALGALGALGALVANTAPIPVSGLVFGPGSGPGGSPVAGARVLLIPTPGLAEAARLEMEGKSDPDPAATATTGADGSFRLEAPEAGMWKVAVQARGMTPQEILLQPLLEETELPPVRLESDVRLEVRVSGADGKPLAGARVQAGDMGGLRGFRMGLRHWQVPERIALTDATGVAVLPRGARERLLVRAGVSGQSAGQLSAEQREVASGSVALRLAAGTAREIRLMDAAGKAPVPGAWVRTGESRWLAGRTGEDGRFAVPVAARGKVKAVLTAEDGRQVEIYAEAPKPEEKEPRILKLPALEILAGRVVSAADGRPVAGALVWSQDPGAARRAGADGAYRIDVIAGREAGLRAAAAGYLPADAAVGVSPGMRRGPTLALEPALVAAGMVVDEQDRPVPGVQVQAAPQPATRMRSPAMMLSGGAARTAASGRFRISGLVAGLGYDLRLSKAGFAAARAEVPPLDPGRPGSGGTGGTGGTDLRIVLRKGRLGFGRVVDRSDQPVAGARVELVPARGSDRRINILRLRESAPVRYEAAADATGRFEVRDLPAGTWELTARGSGFAPLTVPGLLVPEGGGSTDLGTVVLAPGVAIEGYAVDAEGRPVAGAEIHMSEAGGDPMSRFLRQEEPLRAATSAQDGYFRIEDRRAGETVDLEASRSGYAPGVASGVQVPPEQPVRIVLQPSSAVEGRTVDPDGKPVAGVRVFVHSTDPASLGGGLRRFSMANTRQAFSDEAGFFRLEDVIPGGFGLQAAATGYQPSSLDNLEVRAGQELKGLEVVLAPGAVVEGRVFSPSGQPLSGAEVGVADPTMDFFFGAATTDGDGRFRLEGIAPGTRSVQAEHQSYRRAVKELEVRLGDNSVDLRLEGGVEVSGRVVDEGGVPVASARVALRAGPGSWNQPSATSGADGSFTLDGVADGTYRVTADKEGFARSRDGVEVTVAGSSVGGIEVKLTAGGSIVGQLTGLDFAELSQVQIWTMSGRQAGQVSPDGSYRIDHVEPGEHRVTASLAGGTRQAEGQVTLEPGASEARLDLDFGGGLTLSGRVLRNGEAARGLSIMLSGAGVSGRYGDTDHEGRFRFEGLDAGQYDLQVFAFQSGARHREPVDLSADRDVLIELQTVAVSGRVVDAADQSPIPNAQVMLLAAQTDDNAPWQNTETTTDSRGVFRLRDVAEGSWKVRAIQAGYAPEEVDLQVDSGRPVDGLELSLDATEGIVLEVVLPSGRPPDLVHTAVFDAAGRVVSRASYPAGEDGRVRVASVAPGTWDLYLDSDVSAAVVVPVTAPGNAGRVVLPPAGSLSLRVPGLSEARVGATVKLTDASGRPFRVPWGAQVMQDFDLQGGTRRFEKLPPGPWTLDVTATDGRTWTGSATVVPGGLAEVTLQ